MRKIKIHTFKPLLGRKKYVLTYSILDSRFEDGHLVDGPPPPREPLVSIVGLSNILFPQQYDNDVDEADEMQVHID